MDKVNQSAQTLRRLSKILSLILKKLTFGAKRHYLRMRIGFPRITFDEVEDVGGKVDEVLSMQFSFF